MRTLFRLQESYQRIYRVGQVISGRPECQFTTIQAAINQALADGATSAGNPALIEIYNKGSNYVENLTFYPGIHLIGMCQTRETYVNIQGAHTFSYSGGGGAGGNVLGLERLNFVAQSGTGPNLTISGTGACRVIPADCSFSREGLNDGVSIIVMSNSNGNTQMRAIDIGVFYDDNTGTGVALDVQFGQMRITGGFSNIAGTTNETLVRVSNNAQFRMHATGGNAAGSIAAGAGALPAVVINGASAVVQLYHVTLFGNSNASFNMFSFAAAGNVLIRHTMVFLNLDSQRLADGAAGSIFVGQCNFSNGSNLASRSIISGGITVNIDSDGLRIKKEAGNTITCIVGAGGFPNISAAITYLGATQYQFFNKKITVNYNSLTENITIPSTFSNLSIEGNQNGMQPVDQYRPQFTRLNGNITWNPDGGGAVTLSNLYVTAQTGQSALVFGGTGNDAFMYVQKCHFEQSQDSLALPTILKEGSGLGQEINFADCHLERSSSNDGQVISLTNGRVRCYNTTLRIAGATSPFRNASFLVRAAGCLADFNGCLIEGSAEKGFILADGILDINNCTFNLDMKRGTIFQLLGLCQLSLTTVRLQVSSFEEGALIARSGVQSEANFLLTGNVYNPGDGFNVNGVDFINGVDFVVGANANETRDNVVAAINASVDPLIDGIIYASNSFTGIIALYAMQGGVAGDAYTLALAGTPPALASGANFTDGVDGDVGSSFQYGNLTCPSGFTNSSADITTFEYQKAVTLV